MFKNILMLFCFSILFIAQSASADKGNNTSFAASIIICDSCSYSISSSTIYKDNAAFTQTDHVVSADIKSTDAVRDLFLTLKFDEEINIVTMIDITITGYDSLFFYTHDTTDGYWCNVEIYGINSALSDADLFTLRTLSSICISEDDSSVIVFEELYSKGFANEIFDTIGTGNKHTGFTLNSGNIKVHEPDGNIKLDYILETLQTTVDESYVGGQVELKVYFNENFDHHEGFEFTLAFDEELDFDSVITTSYSSGATGSSETDTSIVISTPSSGEMPTEGNTVLLVTAMFTIDTTASSETDYKVRIKGDYTLNNCVDYYYTGSNSDSDYVYLSTIKDTAAWKFTHETVNKETPNWAYNFQLQNSSPVATDGPAGTSNARITVDKSQFTNETPDGASGAFTYQGSYIKWSSSETADTLQVEENDDDDYSTWIRPSDNFTDVGFMRFDIGSSTGIDTVEHLDFTDPNNEVYYGKDNFVVLKYSGDTLRKIDGNLDLITGSIEVVSPPPGGGTGCPMLYTWDGSDYTLENTILTQSQGKSDPEPEDDFYPFAFGVVPEDGYYKIQIREYENEITYLDEIELVTVDYNENDKIAISNKGEIFTYDQAIAPLSAVDKWGRDLMPYIGALDDVWMDVDYAGSMILTYKNYFNEPEYASGKNSDRNLSLISDPVIPPIKKMVTVESTGGQGNDITAEIEDADGNWYYLGAIPPREIKSENSKFLFDAENTDLGETFRVKITWKSSFSTDMQALYLGKGDNFIETRYSAEEVIHSEIGTVNGKLSASNGSILTIEPGQIVDLKFKVENYDTGEMNRKRFFLKSHGYYKTLTNELVPEKFTLADNYPNPFNPSTTINFSIPVQSEVSIVVFNILGQEVITLHEGSTEAGNHQVIWGGDNNYGQQVSSGVYLYRLKTGDIEVTKKMMLLK